MRIAFFGGDRPLTHHVFGYLESLPPDIPVRVLGPPPCREDLEMARPDIGVSVLYRHKIPTEVLALFPRGVVNLHLGYLPWNRDAMPNVWPIIDGTPAGVTLHWMDAGLDTGDIIAQRRVEIEPTDTGETLYYRLCEAAYTLFVDTWPSIVDGTAPRIKQAAGGSYHRSRDVEAIDRIELEEEYWSEQRGFRPVWDCIRARTFPPYKGCYYEEGGKRVYVRVELEEG